MPTIRRRWRPDRPSHPRRAGADYHFAAGTRGSPKGGRNMRIWIVRGLIGVAAVVVLALVVIYAGSEWKLRQGYDVATAELVIPSDAASIAEGGRLAKIAGCRDCHGPNGQGLVLLEDPMLGRIAPPALAAAARRYTDAQLERAIRHGIRRDGSTLFVMPAGAHRHLSDDDTARIIAWIRSLRTQPNDSAATTSFGPLGRALLLAGVIPPSAHPETVSARTRPADMGRYVVDFSCSGCHALHTSRPSDDGKQTVPPLAIVAAAYDPAAFKTLMRTGLPPSGRNLGMMTEAAKGGLHVLSDAEIEQVHAYLKLEAEKTPPQ
ncbi:MAG: c-type cytochrome [Sphingomonadales bacterium]|nr:MAG: c-type cytochrome [Sphingomonadales bacterium]